MSGQWTRANVRRRPATAESRRAWECIPSRTAQAADVHAGAYPDSASPRQSVTATAKSPTCSAASARLRASSCGRPGSVTVARQASANQPQGRQRLLYRFITRLLCVQHGPKRLCMQGRWGAPSSPSSLASIASPDASAYASGMASSAAWMTSMRSSICASTRLSKAGMTSPNVVSHAYGVETVICRPPTRGAVNPGPHRVGTSQSRVVYRSCLVSSTCSLLDCAYVLPEQIAGGATPHQSCAIVACQQWRPTQPSHGDSLQAPLDKLVPANRPSLGNNCALMPQGCAQSNQVWH